MSEERIASGQGKVSENLSLDLLLAGDIVELRPMQLGHVDGLIAAASSGELWNLRYTNVPKPSTMRDMVEHALQQRECGSEFPFVVHLKSTGEVVGTTRYYYIEPNNRNMSIGFTWYAEKFHRSGVNTESKYLLLNHAFDVMNCISVQWHTDHRNKRSQAAIKRLGATFEGVLRNHKIMPDGVIRHTHCFSMLDTEWPESKDYLQSRLLHYKNNNKSMV